MNDVLVIGNCAVDVLAGPIDDWPPPGGLRTAATTTLATGGCAVNVAVALGRLGLTCDLVTRVGQDLFGKFLVDELEAAGVSTDGVVIDPEAATPMTFVAVHADGQRSFVHHRGTNDRIRKTDVLRNPLAGRRVVVVGGAMVMERLDGPPTAEVLAAARAAGATTVLDTVFVDEWPTARWRELLDPVLPHVDVFAPSLAEAQQLAGRDDPVEAVRVLADRGARSVVVKTGARGALVRDRSGRETHVPALAVEAVDTTGAGDCFCAGLVHALHRGASLIEATRLGNAVARHCVTTPGATEGVPPLHEVLRLPAEGTTAADTGR